MAAEVHRSIADGRRYKTQLRRAGRRSVPIRFLVVDSQVFSVDDSFRPQSATSPATTASSTRSRTASRPSSSRCSRAACSTTSNTKVVGGCTEVYWREAAKAMIMGPAWFADAGERMDSAAAARGRSSTRPVQNQIFIDYSPTWNDVLRLRSSAAPTRRVDRFSQCASPELQGPHQSLRRTLEPAAAASARGGDQEVGVSSMLHQGSSRRRAGALFISYLADQPSGSTISRSIRPFPAAPPARSRAAFTSTTTNSRSFSPAFSMSGSSAATRRACRSVRLMR